MKESDLKIYDVPMSDIYSDDDFNCRGKIAPIDVLDLVKSIEQHGLQQPIVIQPYDKMPGKKFRIVAGHRRYVAFVILKKDFIPAKINEGLTELEARTFNLIENLKRQNLNMYQEARAIIPYKNAGMTQEDVANMIGMSRGWVQIRFIILDFPPDIQQECAAGFLTQEQIREINMYPRSKQYEVVKLIKERKDRGEKRKISVKPPKKTNPLARKERDAFEIFAMQDTIRELFGNGLPTRLLAWCAGEISDLDIHRDIRDEAEKQGKKYTIPREMVEALGA